MGHYKKSRFPHNPETKTVVFLGSAITQTDYSGSSWRIQAMAWLNANKPAWLSYAFWNNAGTVDSPWDVASQLSLKCLNYRPSLVIWDTLFDAGTDTHKVSIEALIRKLWQRDHATRLVLMGFPSLLNLSDSSILAPLNATQLAYTKSLAASYGAAYCDIYAELLNQVQNFGHHLTEYYSDVSTLNAAGHNLAFAVLTPLLAGAGRIAGLPGGDRADRWITINPATQKDLTGQGTGPFDSVHNWNGLVPWAKAFVSAGLCEFPPPSASWI